MVSYILKESQILPRRCCQGSHCQVITFGKLPFLESNHSAIAQPIRMIGYAFQKETTPFAGMFCFKLQRKPCKFFSEFSL